MSGSQRSSCHPWLKLLGVENVCNSANMLLHLLARDQAGGADAKRFLSEAKFARYVLKQMQH